ncbi:DUF7519 family protein [Halapricum desulfuricans]|nr:hypothetical protein [Halapricum desulfuricans]
MTAPDRQPAWLTSRLAAALVSALVVVHGFVAGVPVVAFLALLGALALVRAARSLAVDRSDVARTERAASTIGFVLGALVVVLALAHLDPIARSLLGLPIAGFVLVGLAGHGAIYGPHAGAFTSVYRRSRVTFVVAALLFAFVQGILLSTTVSRGVAWLPVLFSWRFGIALVAFELVVYALVVSLLWAQRELDERLGTERVRQTMAVTVGGRSVHGTLRAVHTWVRDHWIVAGVQVVGVFLLGGTVEAVLLSAVPVGPLVVVLFASGLAHALVGVLVAVALSVRVAAFVHDILFRPLQDPMATGTDVTGAVLVAVGSGLLSLLVPDALTSVLPSGAATDLSSAVGPAAVLVGLLALVGIVAPFVVFILTQTAVVVGLAAERTSGFSIGSALVLLGSIVAAEQGAPAVVVFVGVAVAVLAWEFGEQATYLGVTVGDDTDDVVETVHAVAAVAVGVVGIAVASGVGYLFGPISVGPDRAVVAIVLALVAAVAAVATLDSQTS